MHNSRALSSAAERCLDTAEVTGSIPVAPTMREPLRKAGFLRVRRSSFERSGHAQDAHRTRFVPVSPRGSAPPTYQAVSVQDWTRLQVVAATGVLSVTRSGGGQAEKLLAVIHACT